jgi:hypothetical protein
MSRTPAVALLGLLLGLSGCAGVPQRVGWSSSTDRSDATESPTPSRLTWWRRPRAENASTDQPAKIAETRETAQPAVSTKLPTDVWPESRSEWLARRFPLLSRRLNGPTVSSVDDDARFRELNGRLLAPWSTPAGAARGGREDVDVRPVDVKTTNDDASSGDHAVAGQGPQRTPPVLGTPLVVKARPYSLPETSGDVTLDINQVAPRQASQALSRETELASAQPEPAASSSADPASDLAVSAVDRQSSDAPSNGQPDAAMDPAQPKQASSSTVDSASVLAMSAGDRPSSEAPADSQAEVAPESTTAPTTDAELETLLAQAPAPPAPNTQPPSSIPPAPPLRQTPPPAPPIVGDKPAAIPAQPETSTTPASDAAKPKEADETTAQPAQAPSTPETPPAPPQTPVSPVPTTAAPVSTPAASPAPRYGQPLASVSKRSPYASLPPMAPPPPRRKFLGLFFVEETPRPLASPQLPPAMFPASYHVQTPQTAQAQPASQAVAATPPVACNAPPKPCVLSVLFQKIKSCGKRFGCLGCHHGGSAPCCQGCTCYTGTNKPVQASPQASLPSSPGKLAFCQGHPTTQMAPLGSNGTEPGDVTEEGKLFERVSFESFDKAIER